jgi:polysaccharide export outer membrane protein
MRPICIICIGVLGAAFAPLGEGQVSTFPTPPPLPPPADHASTGGSNGSSGQAVAPYPGDAEPAIQTPGATAAAGSTNAPPVTPVTAATLTSMAALDDKIPLEEGDTISFRVIEDRDQAIQLVVTDTGEVNFPYINRVKVEGKTCHQVAMEVKKLLEVDYYKQATVIVGLDIIIGADKTKAKDLAWVVGEVRQVGPFELQKAQPMTVSQIILRAGGFGDFADQRRVKVIHRSAQASNTDSELLDPENVKDAQIIDVKSVFDGKSNVDPMVKSGDYIIVPKEIIHF